MIRVPLAVVFLLGAVAGPASAQSPIYGGGMFALDARHGTFEILGTMPAAGGFIGWRFGESSWSLELHVDRGLRASDELETVEFFGREIYKEHGGVGYSILAVWKAPFRGRIGTAVTMGISSRSFRTDTVLITGESTGNPIRTSSVHEDAGGGPTGGLLVPIALGDGWSLAPELRMGLALTGESGGYLHFYSGVRVMWGF